MPDYNSQKYSTLMQLLGQGLAHGAAAGSAGAEQQMRGNQGLEQLIKGKGLDQENQAAQIQGMHAADLDSQDQAIARAKKLSTDLSTGSPRHKYNVGVSKEGATISEADAQPSPLLDRIRVNKEAELSKRYEKLNGFNSALTELDARSAGKDGNGGVLTNPNASLISTGKITSKVPTSIMGLGELLGVAPSGVSDERKLLERLQLEYQRAMTGQRTSADMAAREKEALGWISSGDPALVAKGVRSMARNVKNQFNTIQGGYGADIQSAVHSRMGNPMDAYAHLYEDGPIGAKPAPLAPAPGVQPPQTAPVAPVDPARARLEELRKKAAQGQ